MIIQFFPDIWEKINLLPIEEAARIVKVIEIFEIYGFSLTAKHLKKITHGLWELRGGRWRILFGKSDDKIYIVGLFLKKTQEIPLKEIKKSLKRLSLVI